MYSKEAKNKIKARWRKSSKQTRNVRIDVFRYGMVLVAGLIILRLFVLQVVDHKFYQALASGQHEIFQELFPSRGDILVHDSIDGRLVPVASTQELAFIFADPRHIEDPGEVAEKLGELFGYDEDKIEALKIRLDQPDDPYEPIERKVSIEMLDEIVAMNLPGINHIREEARLYPEQNMSGHVIGFVGSNEDGSLSGRYGIEGYFNSELSGSPGFFRSERDIAGRLIAIGDRSIEPAIDGADIVLTIDRTIQYFACSALQNAVKRHQADGGSVVILDPSDGRVLAMCGAPDFDPANYVEVEDINLYNNPAIFNAYEPGSVFKPITMAAALDSGAVTPSTTYNDTGEVIIDVYTINNSDGNANGIQTMTEALEKSLNTGMIWAMRQTGKDVFREYVSDFGFGEYTGIDLETEMAGTISSLYLDHEVYAATASYGQGITVTPLQLAAAYAAIANGGILKKPYIIDEIRYPDGTVEKRQGQDIRRVIEAKTSRLLGAMLISVIEHGHGGQAGVPGFYVAGKTGTAQVAKPGGGYYGSITIGTFAGFAPVEDPKFAMVVRIDRPRTVQWAESTAAPLFGEIADFLLKYFEVPPSRSIE